MRRIERLNRKPGDLTGYDCPACKNRGYVFRLAQDGRELCDPCACMEVRKSLRRIERSGLKQAIEEKTFANFEPTEDWQRKAKETARHYAKEPSGWLLACGQPGAGKTHLCTAVAGELLKKGIAVRYMLWREEATKLKASILTDDYSKKMRLLQSAQCLYLDDFWKGAVKDADINLAFELLDYRYRNNLPTILSTEKTLRKLMEIDEAVGSRIREKSASHRIWIEKDSNKNYRNRKGKQDAL